MIQISYKSRVKRNPKSFQMFVTEEQEEALYIRINTWQTMGYSIERINSIIANFTKQDLDDIIAHQKKVEEEKSK